MSYWDQSLRNQGMPKQVNILSPEFINDPYTFFEQLRRDAPVSQVEPMGIWAVTRYEDVMRVLRTPDVFSSTAFQTVFRALSPAMTESDLLVLNSMIAKDPPDHTRLRRLVNRAFTPKAIAALDPSADLVITQNQLTDRAKAQTPDAVHVSVDNFMNSPKYDEVVEMVRTQHDGR